MYLWYVDKLIAAILFLIIGVTCFSQNIEKISKSDPLKASGSINASSIYFISNAEEQQRDPFYWVVNGNFNLNIYNVLNVPVSFILSKENQTFNQPSYKQFGLSPQYKDFTMHLGYRNMVFSKYTMSGITFMGGGLEYAPKNSMFKIKGFYGRFARANNYTPASAFNTADVIEPASYERWGYGSMITLGRKKQILDLIFFKAIDDILSVDSMPEASGVKPSENFILGFNTRNTITSRLKFGLEYSLSAYTEDTRLPEYEQESYSYINNFGYIFTPRQSSCYNSAINSSLNYSFKRTNLGFSFRRIDPAYKSMGTSFLNNDVQETTLDMATSLMKNKIMISANAGMQSNNLDKSLLTTTRRFISSLNCSWIASRRFTLSATLSNFNTDATPERVYLIDSIKYAQITQNYALNGNYRFGDSIVVHNFGFNTTYQYANTLNNSGTEISDVTTSFMNSILSYNLALPKKKTSFVTSVNYSSFNTAGVITQSIGPAIGIIRNVYRDKIRLGLNGTYLTTSVDGDNSGQVINMRFNASYKINKHHTLKLISNFLVKKQNTGDFNQSQTNLTYNYIF